MLLPCELRRLANPQGVEWSTSTVRGVVRAQALQLGLALAADDALPELQDVDTAQVCLLPEHLGPSHGGP